MILLEPLYSHTKSGEPEAVPATASAAIPHVNLLLDDYPNAGHAYIYAAQINGYFRDEGLVVDILLPNSSLGDPLASVAAGGADVALVHGPELLLARDRQLPVRSIAAIVKRPLTYVAVEQASPIHSAKHLIGKKIGYAGKPYYEAIIRQMLRQADADYSEADLVDIGSSIDYAKHFEDGMDALIGPTLHRDRFLLERKHVRIRLIEPMLSKVPAYYELVLAAEEQAVEADPDRYKKLWRALQRGQQYVEEHPQEAIEFVMRRQSVLRPLDEEVELEALRLLLSFEESEELSFGQQHKNIWSDTEKWLHDVEMIGDDTRGEDAFTNVIIEE